MEVLKWTKDLDFEDTYYKIKKYGNTFYKIEIFLCTYSKSAKVWASVSSGKKRKHLESFEENNYSRDGGIKALVWCKEEILSIFKFIEHIYNIEGLNKYICIGWSDSKRRNVYSRLEKEGFYFMVEDRLKILMKKIN